MKLVKPKLLVFIGIQGSGKGTQASLLSKKLNLQHIIAGDIFRIVAQEPTPLGKSVADNLNHGRIMTIEQWAAVVGHYLEMQDLRQGVILDGVLRSPEQVSQLAKIISTKHLPAVYLIYLRLNRDQALARLLIRGREDDKPEQLAERFRWSEQQTLPVVDLYRELGQITEVNADQSIEDTQAEIVAKLKTQGLISD
ncbi:nucleoside monophosphate kinase [Candidatus Berkelbacteria bacterium]|nr:nucleoside monophosphate kinase [Candidatus Berkelbacteria bacterium]